MEGDGKVTKANGTHTRAICFLCIVANIMDTGHWHHHCHHTIIIIIIFLIIIEVMSLGARGEINENLQRGWTSLEPGRKFKSGHVGIIIAVIISVCVWMDLSGILQPGDCCYACGHWCQNNTGLDNGEDQDRIIITNHQWIWNFAALESC